VKRDLISEVNALAEQMSCTSAYVEKSVVLSYGGLNCEVAVLSRCPFNEVRLRHHKGLDRLEQVG